MRDYIIINGVNSLTITGLAISKLPSISKPPLRVMTEEINGRDGDLITELGYGAYDKELTIGLYGNFDIDEVIAYFNQEGTIVFSNEDDKYYNFKIINEIDYEALIKFRTATITLHCQPFKYPLAETPIEITNEYVEGEGETITLNNTKASTLDIDLKGNTSQTGTPTPSSPIPVNVVSGDNEVVVCGKNLFNKDNSQIGKAWNNASASNRAIVITKVEPSTTYNITYQDKSGVDGIYFFGRTNKDDSIASMATTEINTNPRQVITLANTNYIGIQFNKANVTQSDIDNVGIQLEKGGATTYQPYTGATYPLYLGTTELCKIGNYQDYIFKNGDKWYLHKEIGKEIFNGNENYSLRTDIVVSGYKCYRCSTFDYTLLGDISSAYSNYFEYVQSGAIANTFRLIKTNNYAIQFIISETLASDKDAFKTWLSTHNTIVYYVLATATETEITNTTLINQLESLKGAMSYEGQTNISQTNNDLPFILSASALKTGSGEAVANNIGNIYAKPIIELEGTGNIGIYKNGTQYFEVDMSNDSKITIDTENMEAYHNGVLKNRKVIGDYNKFTIDEGNNNIEITGELTKATITKYTRYL